eukprot:1155704-Pelagomonas_calceolata.AAC.4
MLEAAAKGADWLVLEKCSKWSSKVVRGGGGCHATHSVRSAVFPDKQTGKRLKCWTAVPEAEFS